MKAEAGLAGPEAVLFTDADNTLWDTDAVFAAAQIALLAEVEAETGRAYAGDDRLEFVRRVDQALAERHHSGLRYPPRLLARAVALATTSMPPAQAARLALNGAGLHSGLAEFPARAIEEHFLAGIAGRPALRPGVGEAMAELRSDGCRIFVVTEGARRKVARLADLLGIGTFLDRIIESPKRPELYRRVLRLAGSPERAFMVGDQLDRDIAPAKAAGLGTIWFPGGFRPVWEPDEHRVSPGHVVASFAEVPAILSPRNGASAASA